MTRDLLLQRVAEGVSSDPVCSAHLDFLAVNFDQPLPEVHPDRGLGLLRELAGTEAVREAGLPDARIPDHDDFEDAGPRRR